jgi:hypothetical protein
MGPGLACGRGRRGPGSRQDARLAEVGGVGRAHAGAGGSGPENRGGGEADDRWGPVTVLAV